jgi:ketosteroid isomerase-like protein
MRGLPHLDPVGVRIPKEEVQVKTATSEAADGLRVARAFNDALNRGDLPGMLECLSEDTVFENTSPAPDGERYVGRAAVAAFWGEFLRAAERVHIEVEEVFALGDRCVMRWRYEWRGQDGGPGHVRGVDLYRVRGGLIVEKLSYVKG